MTGADVATGYDEARAVNLYPVPQRPAAAEGPEQHISMAGAEIHGHPESCCCHAPCVEPACSVPT